MAEILWMDDGLLFNGKNFMVKLGTKLIPGILTRIICSIDVNTGKREPADVLRKNEIALCEISFAEEIPVDNFDGHRSIGELILIDRITNMTAACGVIKEVGSEESGRIRGKVDRRLRSMLKSQEPAVFEFGIDGSGADMGFVQRVEKKLSESGRHTYLYAPGPGEDYTATVRNLYNAGIIVLLALSAETAQDKSLAGEPYYHENFTDSCGADAELAAESIIRATVFKWDDSSYCI